MPDIMLCSWFQMFLKIVHCNMRLLYLDTMLVAVERSYDQRKYEIINIPRDFCTYQYTSSWVWMTSYGWWGSQLWQIMHTSRWPSSSANIWLGWIFDCPFQQRALKGIKAMHHLTLSQGISLSRTVSTVLKGWSSWSRMMIGNYKQLIFLLWYLSLEGQQ